MYNTTLATAGRWGRWLAATAAFLIVPSFAQAGVITRAGGAQPDFHYGTIHFHPKSITLAVNYQLGGSAKFKVKQKGNTDDRFKAQIACDLNLGSPPKVKMNGNVGTIYVPSQKIFGVSINCTVTVLGEGGVTGALPVLIDLNP
jgi:hypothetical protein